MANHPVGLSLEETRAFHEKAWSHVLGVVNLKEEVDEGARIRSEGLGTGAACLWRGKRAVLTAKHLLRAAGPDDIAFLPRTGTALGWDSPGKINGVSERVVVGIETIVRCEWEDLAVIVLDPDGLERLNVDFCELPKMLANDQSVGGQGSVLVIGFPVDQAFGVSEQRRSGQTTTLLACPCESFWGRLKPAGGRVPVRISRRSLLSCPGAGP